MQFTHLLIPLLTATALALPNAPLEQRSADTPWIGHYHQREKGCTGDKHDKVNLTTPNTLVNWARPAKGNVGVHFGSGKHRTDSVNAYVDVKGKKIAHTFTYDKDVFQCFNDENDRMWAVEWKSAEAMGKMG